MQEILQKLRDMRDGHDRFVDLALTASADFIVGLLDVILRYGDDEKDWELVYELLDIAAARATPSHICALIAQLRARNGDTYAHHLLSAIAVERMSSRAVVDIVAALRESQQPADAYQLLSAAGRDRHAWLIHPVLLLLSHADACWLLEAVTAERTAVDIVMVRAMLSDSGHEQYVELLPPRTLMQAWREPSLTPGSTTPQLVT